MVIRCVGPGRSAVEDTTQAGEDPVQAPASTRRRHEEHNQGRKEGDEVNPVPLGGRATVCTALGTAYFMEGERCSPVPVLRRGRASVRTGPGNAI